MADFTCLTLCLGRKNMTSEPLGPGVINLTGPLPSSGAWLMAQKKVFKVSL